jgi:hypothetical protein
LVAGSNPARGANFRHLLIVLSCSPDSPRPLAAQSFEAAREAFQRAWPVFLAKRTPTDFEAWRQHQAWTEEKYRRFDRGEKMPPDWKPPCLGI